MNGYPKGSEAGGEREVGSKPMDSTMSVETRAGRSDGQTDQCPPIKLHCRFGSDLVTSLDDARRNALILQARADHKTLQGGVEGFFGNSLFFSV